MACFTKGICAKPFPLVAGHASHDSLYLQGSLTSLRMWLTRQGTTEAQTDRQKAILGLASSQNLCQTVSKILKIPSDVICWYTTAHIIGLTLYSDGQKYCTFFLEFFVPPPWNRSILWNGVLQLVGWHFTKSTCSKIGPPPPGGGHKKNREKMCKTFARYCKE